MESVLDSGGLVFGAVGLGALMLPDPPGAMGNCEGRATGIGGIAVTVVTAAVDVGAERL
jgi:hypothetical protein